MKKYRVWLEDSVEPEGGSWWNCYLGDDGKLHDYKWPDPDYGDTPLWYIDNGYIVEEV